MAGSRDALIIATGTYDDPELRRLRSPAQDADSIARVLSDPSIGEFNVRTIVDQPARLVTRAAQEFFADRSLDDLLLLHISCHGVKDDEGRFFFAARDTEKRWLASTGISGVFVYDLMERTRARSTVLLLDCCYSGAFVPGAKGDDAVGLKERFQGEGRAILTASDSIEYSWEGDDLSGAGAPSVFTAALVEGLETGAADRDRDGMVSVDDLYNYVYERVRADRPGQTPKLWQFGVEKNLFLAKNPRPIEPEPKALPVELQAALESPLSSVRASVVGDLSRLLRGSDPGLRLAAEAALTQLLDDDSRMVSLAARAALEERPSRDDQGGVDEEPLRPPDVEVKTQAAVQPTAPRATPLRKEERKEERKPQDAEPSATDKWEGQLLAPARAAPRSERQRDYPPAGAEPVRDWSRPTAAVGGLLVGAAFFYYVSNIQFDSPSRVVDIAACAALGIAGALLWTQFPMRLHAGLLAALGAQSALAPIAWQRETGSLFLPGNALAALGAILLLIASVRIYVHLRGPNPTQVSGRRSALVLASLLPIAGVVALEASIAFLDSLFQPFIVWNWVYVGIVGFLTIGAVGAILARDHMTAVGLLFGITVPAVTIYTAVWWEFGHAFNVPSGFVTVVSAWVALVGSVVFYSATRPRVQGRG